MSLPKRYFDLFCDFSGLSNGVLVTAAALNASTFGAPPNWNTTGTDGGVPSNSNLTGDTASASGVSDGLGSLIGLKYASAVAQAGAVEYILPIARPRVSWGFAFKTSPLSVAFGEEFHNFQSFNSGFGPMTRLSDERDSGNDAHQIRLSPGGPGDPTTVVGISDSTWYWLTWVQVKGDVCRLAVYDASLNLVGTARYQDVANSKVTSFQLGNFITGSDAPSISGSYASLIADWTNGAWPLLPTAGVFGKPNTIISRPAPFRPGLAR